MEAQLHRRRQRQALSCLSCRRRKIKCSRDHPCAQCGSSKIQCIYKTHNGQPIEQQRSLQGNPFVRNSNTPTESSLSATVLGDNVNANDNTSVPDEVQPPIPSTFNGRDDSTHRPNLQASRQLEEFPGPKRVHALSETSRDIIAQQTGVDSHVILEKERLARWNIWMGAAKEFKPIIACFTAVCGNWAGTSFEQSEKGPMIAEIGDLLQKCKNVARSMKIGRPSRCLSYPDFDLAPPSRELADAMVSCYFESFESAHRILHVPTFRAHYERYWDNPKTVTTDLRLKVFLVIGIGFSLFNSEEIDHTFHRNVHRWIYAAQAWLSGPLEKDRLNISGLQVYCLTVLARQIFSVGGDLVWISMGSLINRAMQIGLHRDPKHLPPMSILQAELRRRLWATILEMNVQVSLGSAMLPRISLDEFDTGPPSNNNDDEINESTMFLQPHPKDIYTTSSMQLLLFDSLPTRLRILRLLNGLNSKLSYTDVIALSSEITGAYRSCTKFMRENERFGVTAFHRNMLDYLLYRFLIPLHASFASNARTNPLFQHSLKTISDVAMTLVSPEPDEKFSRLLMISGGFLREGIVEAATVISLELAILAETQRLDGTLHRNNQYRGLLKDTIRKLIDLSSERIRRSETNVKLHMFLNMLMAQVEAIETDTSFEVKVAEGAKMSLQFCYDLLLTRAENMNVSLQSPNSGDFESLNFDNVQENYGVDLDLEFFLPGADFL